jgi:hypothetical protein
LIEVLNFQPFFLKPKASPNEKKGKQKEAPLPPSPKTWVACLSQPYPFETESFRGSPSKAQTLLNEESVGTLDLPPSHSTKSLDPAMHQPRARYPPGYGSGSGGRGGGGDNGGGGGGNQNYYGRNPQPQHQNHYHRQQPQDQHHYHHQQANMNASHQQHWLRREQAAAAVAGDAAGRIASQFDAVDTRQGIYY